MCCLRELVTSHNAKDIWIVMILTLVPHPTRRPIKAVVTTDPDVAGKEGYVVRRLGAIVPSMGKLIVMPAKNAAIPTVGRDTSCRMYSDAPKIPPFLWSSIDVAWWRSNAPMLVSIGVNIVKVERVPSLAQRVGTNVHAYTLSYEKNTESLANGRKNVVKGLTGGISCVWLT